ncbi:unnamed protein product, partial [Ectocarpus sp. 12 AP-2014]
GLRRRRLHVSLPPKQISVTEPPTELAIRCGVCDKVFDREDKMQIHQATHARAGDGDFIRPYHCNVRGCGKAFTEKRNLNAHRRTAHTE